MQKKTVDLIFVNRPKRTERIPKQRGRDREALRVALRVPITVRRHRAL